MKELGTLLWDEQLGGLSLMAPKVQPDIGKGYIVSTYRPDGTLFMERFYYSDTAEDAIKTALRNTEGFQSETESYTIVVETQAVTLTGYRERHYVEPEFKVKTV